MKHTPPLLILLTLALAAGCTSQKKLAYLYNLPEPDGQAEFSMEMPEYKIQPRDILYISAKAMTPEGNISDYLSAGRISTSSNNATVYESGQYLYGYDVNSEGEINLPIIGKLTVSGMKLDEIRQLLQTELEKIIKNVMVDCKLLSFKFTVIGEIRNPGTYINYNNYLTVLEAIGRAGGIGDFGRRDRILVVRPTDKGTKTYKISVQDKNLLSSPAYFLLPNDVVIVEPVGHKVFNMNLPTYTFIITTVTGLISTTLLLINYLE